MPGGNPIPAMRVPWTNGNPRAQGDGRRPVPFRLQEGEVPVDRLLAQLYPDQQGAAGLAQRKILNNLQAEVPGGGGAAAGSSAAAGAGGGQPPSGRRSKLGGAGGAAASKRGATKVTDMDLLSSMAGRLAALEKKLQEQKKAVVEKDAEIAELKSRLEEERQQRQDTRCEEQDAAALADENLRLRRNQLEMEKFLADYGLVWVGDKPIESKYEGDGQAGVASNLVPLDPAGKQQPLLARRSDGSLIAAPRQPQQHSPRAVPSAAPAPGDDASGSASATGAAAAPGGGSGGAPADGADAAEATIEAFDGARIMHNVQELNYLAGDGSAKMARRADGAHVLVEQEALPLTLYRDGLMIREGPFRPYRCALYRPAGRQLSVVGKSYATHSCAREKRCVA